MVERQADFDAIVKRLEAGAQADPDGHQRKVAWMVALAYLGMPALLTLALAVLAGCAWKAFPSFILVELSVFAGSLSLGLLWAIGACVWIRLPAPTGVPVTAKTAPALHALIAELCTQLNCPRFHRVVITGRIQVRATQLPRLGVLGWNRNYLEIGLPVLQTLPPEEFKAVLAHELSHCSRGPGRFGNWLYRLRLSWERIVTTMEEQRATGTAPLRYFLRSYWPVLNANAFLLARHLEYQADAHAAKLAGADAIARALTRMWVRDAWIEQEFWKPFLRRMHQQAEPPRDALVALGTALRRPCPADFTERALRDAFLAETGSHDTHPALVDRLDALERLPPELELGRLPTQLLPSAGRPAVDELLGGAQAAIEQQLSEQLHDEIAARWAERHAWAKRTRASLQQMADAGAGAEDPAAFIDRLWVEAELIEALDGDAAAEPMIGRILSLDPLHAGANYSRGRALLERQDPEGIPFILHAMAANPLLTESGCTLLSRQYLRMGQRERLPELSARLAEFRAMHDEAERTLSSVSPEDRFLPHGLPALTIQELATIFLAERDIGRAAIARKELPDIPNLPAYVVVIFLHIRSWRLRSDSADLQLLRRLNGAIRLPGLSAVVLVARPYGAAANRIASVPRAVVFHRGALKKPPPEG